MIRPLFVLAALVAAPTLAAQSAPVSDISYRVTFDRALASRGMVHVDMMLTTPGNAPVVLGLPAWTPGSYELAYYARYVGELTATGDGRPLRWEKTDYDSWRVFPAGATHVTIGFEFHADSLDVGFAWAQPDFLLFNGANLFLYPEGRGFDFPARVRIVTDSAWRIVTEMAPAGPVATFQASNYHDLVDMPFFIGRVGLDSVRVRDGWARLAWYPVDALPDVERAHELAQVAKIIPVEADVFGEVPWKRYSVMEIFDSAGMGLEGLEHQSSHVDVFASGAIGSEYIPSFFAHEIFHAWNVKRLRPAELWPYQYAHEQPTSWLWVSEGITDYYADLAEARAGLVDREGFLDLTATKVADVARARPIALHDASLNSWIHMPDGTEYVYYPKGSLVGMMLDILIRDGSDGKHSLDDVMRQLYREAYKKGTGFTPAQWWSAVSAAAGGKSFAEFESRYVTGREPLPYASIFPLAALKAEVDSVRSLWLGIQFGGDSATAMVVQGVAPGYTAEDAGVRAGDVLVAIGKFSTRSGDEVAAAAEHFTEAGAPVTLTVRRGAQVMLLPAHARLRKRVAAKVEFDAAAPPKAKGILAAMLSGASPPPPR
jgi:predicted metalloprotease with PDZ domain